MNETLTLKVGTVQYRESSSGMVQIQRWFDSHGKYIKTTYHFLSTGIVIG